MWKQQMHKRCGGGIVVVALDYEIAYACSKCGIGFKSDLKVLISTDWRNVNKKDGLIINNL